MQKDRYTTRIMVRATVAEREAANRLAASHGLSLSDYARLRLLPQSSTAAYVPRRDGIDGAAAMPD
jgi:hypothetical protein